MASKCAAWVIVAGLLVVACSEPAPPGPAVATVAVAPPATAAPAAAEPADAGSAAAGGQDEDAGKAAQPWRERCAAELEAAIVAAVGHEPALNGLWVKRETQGKTNSLSIAAFPPTLRIGGLMVRVQRTPGSAAPAAVAPRWQMSAESLHGGYHASYSLRAGAMEATMLFDGFQSALVQVIAPLFQVAIERCDAMK